MDSIADMFTRIRNGYAAGKDSVAIPYSKIKMDIAKILQKEKYLKGAVRRGKKPKKFLDLELVYNDGVPAVCEIKRVSKPSCRVYSGCRKMFSVRHGHGIKIVSTPNGIMTDKEARKQKVGGEIIGEVC